MKTLNIVWGILIALSMIVALNPAGGNNHTWFYVAVGIVTLVKGWLIINEFMELKHAPKILRRLVQGWLSITTTAVVLSAVASA